jgi:hypothetical protein
MTTTNPEIAHQLCDLLEIKIETPPPALRVGQGATHQKNPLVIMMIRR